MVIATCIVEANTLLRVAAICTQRLLVEGLILGDVVVSNSGFRVGDDISITKAGVNLGGSATIDATSLEFRAEPDTEVRIYNMHNPRGS